MEWIKTKKNNGTINHVYGIIEFIDGKNKKISEGKIFGTILKLGIKKLIKLISSNIKHLHANVLETSLSLPSSSPKEKGFVLVIYSVNHQNLE